jgi:hypothetical protein
VSVRSPILLLWFIVGYSELGQIIRDSVGMLRYLSEAMNTNSNPSKGKRLKITGEKLGMNYAMY